MHCAANNLHLGVMKLLLSSDNNRAVLNAADHQVIEPYVLAVFPGVPNGVIERGYTEPCDASLSTLYPGTANVRDWEKHVWHSTYGCFMTCTGDQNHRIWWLCCLSGHKLRLVYSIVAKTQPIQGSC